MTHENFHGMVPARSETENAEDHRSHKAAMLRPQKDGKCRENLKEEEEEKLWEEQEGGDSGVKV